MVTTAEQLVHECIEAARAGADFPSVWNSILKRHPSVIGQPVQRLDGTTALLEISLISGQRILFGPGRSDYSVA